MIEQKILTQGNPIMILTTFTLVHVAISLVGIFSGLVVAWGLLAAKRLEGWTRLFLITTVLTSVTSFFFPVQHFMPSHGVGIISLLILFPCIIARYPLRLAGHWRLVYVITAMIALYLNVFVLVVQLFEKVPALHEIAPTQADPPFKITQLAVLLIFVVLTLVAAIRFRRASSQPDPSPLPGI
jgi:hypothetical protein